MIQNTLETASMMPEKYFLDYPAPVNPQDLDQLVQDYYEAERDWSSRRFCKWLQKSLYDRNRMNKVPTFTKIVALGVNNMLFDRCKYSEAGVRESFAGTSQLASVLLMQNILNPPYGVDVPIIIDDRSSLGTCKSELEKEFLRRYHEIEVVSTSEALSQIDRDTIIFEVDGFEDYITDSDKEVLEEFQHKVNIENVTIGEDCEDDRLYFYNFSEEGNKYLVRIWIRK